ncbi:MAG: hypothetical protein AB1497_08910 [Bacillota bacterium]
MNEMDLPDLKPYLRSIRRWLGKDLLAVLAYQPVPKRCRLIAFVRHAPALRLERRELSSEVARDAMQLGSSWIPLDIYDEREVPACSGAGMRVIEEGVVLIDNRAFTEDLARRVLVDAVITRTRQLRHNLKLYWEWNTSIGDLAV